MYGREIEGQTFTFGVSGKLILNNLVMYDHQTESYWPQAFGEAVEGPMRGSALELVPSQLMDWGTWKELHPDTLVLDKGRGFPIDTYASYYRGPDSGIIGRAVSDDRLDGKEFAIGLQTTGEEKAYPYRELSRMPVVNDTVGGVQVLVAFDANAATGSIWDRAVGAQTLTFRDAENKTMIDIETGTEWSTLTGIAAAGPLVGERLKQLPTTPSFWFAWLDLFPDTDLFQGTSVE